MSPAVSTAHLSLSLVSRRQHPCRRQNKYLPLAATAVCSVPARAGSRTAVRGATSSAFSRSRRRPRAPSRRCLTGRFHESGARGCSMRPRQRRPARWSLGLSPAASANPGRVWLAARPHDLAVLPERPASEFTHRQSRVSRGKRS